MVLGVRFRIYGYQSVVSSGGLSRLVMENLQMNGIGTILPARILDFSAVLKNDKVNLKYSIANNEPGTSYDIERSVDGFSFAAVNHLDGDPAKSVIEHTISDVVQSYSGKVLYYRLRVTLPDASFVYSSVRTINLTSATTLPISVIQQSNTLVVKNLNGGKELYLLSSGGQTIKALALTANTGVVTLELPQHTPGIYYISVNGEKNRQSQSIYLK